MQSSPVFHSSPPPLTLRLMLKRTTAVFKGQCKPCQMWFREDEL